METIVTKLLGGYLKTFIKNFNQEMLSLQLMKGQATMKDFELVGETLQELIMLPTNLEVKSAKCTLLTMSIPYMNLKHEPITISIERIDIALFEPEVIKPLPNALQSMARSNLSERAERMSVIKGIKFEIKECHISIETLGRNTFHPDWKPSLLIDVQGLVVQSTNQNWEVVDLAQTFLTDKEKNVESLYKQAKVNSITIYSRMTNADTPTAIIENIPCELRTVTLTNSKTGVWLETTLDIIFEELNFSWTQGAWQRMANLGLSLQACFSREIPEREGLDAQALADARNEKMTKVSYGFIIQQFVIELLKGQQGSDDGFTLFGFGLECTMSPLRLTTYTIKDLTGRGTDLVVDCWESILNLTMQNVTFRERRPASEKEPPYNRLVAQVVDTKKTDNAIPPNAPLLSAAIAYRPKIECNEQLKRRVPAVEISARLNGIQVVFDKDAWKDLYTFVVEGPVEAGFMDKGGQIQEQFSEKTLEEWKQYYYLNAKFELLMVDTVFIIPPLFTGEIEDVRTTGLHCSVGKLIMTNQPEWPFPPFLKDALVFLPEREHNLTPAEGTVHKFQGELHNVQCNVHRLLAKGEEIKAVMNPAAFRFYGRFFPPEADSNVHRIEAMFHTSELYGHITPSFVRYFHNLEEEHRKWGIRVQEEEKERRNINKMMRAAESGASEMKSSDVAADKNKFSVQNITKEDIDKAQKIAAATAKYALQNIHTTLFVRIEKGTCELPSPTAFDYLTRQWVNTLNPSGTDEKGKETDELMALGVTEENLDTHTSLFGFDKLEVVADNNISSQSVVLNLRGFKVMKLAHPKLPAAINIRCAGSDSGVNCIELRLTRKCNVPPPYPIIFFSHLHGLQISSTAKVGGLQKGLIELLPDFKILLATVINKMKQAGEAREEIFDFIKEGALRANATAKEVLEGGLEDLFKNIQWRMEVGECEFQYLPADAENSPNAVEPIGQLLLASSAKNDLESRFKAMEDQLVNTKIALAQSESEKFDSQNQVCQSQESVRKAREETKTLETQLVSSRMALAELQAENDNLKSEIKRLNDASMSTTAAAVKKAGSIFSRGSGKGK